MHSEREYGDAGRLRRLPPRIRKVVRSVIPRPPWPFPRLRRALGRLRLRNVRNTLRWIASLRRSIRERRQDGRVTVAVDVDPFWGAMTGVGWYLHRLLEHLAEREDLRLRLYGPTMVLYRDNPEPRVTLPQGPALQAVSYEVPEDLVLSREWLVRLLRRLQSVLLAWDGNQVLFAPNYFLPPRFRFARGRLVAMVHDLSVKRFAWTMKESTRRALVANLEKTVGRAAAVLTHSETVRREILDDGLGGPPEVYAIAPGPGHLGAVEPGRVPSRLPARFILHVGTLEPRKNLTTVLSAFGQLSRRGREPVPLVLCGDLGWKSGDLRQEIHRGEAEGWLHHLGYVDDPTLAALYRAALVVVCPSLYEGFGLPVVEALWAGTAVVCADIPVFREVAGEAALFVPPRDVSAWAEQVAHLVEDEALRRELERRGRERVTHLDWSRTARQTAAVWFQVAGRGRDS